MVSHLERFLVEVTARLAVDLLVDLQQLFVFVLFVNLSVDRGENFANAEQRS